MRKKLSKNWKVFAGEISPAALQIAQKNAKNLNAEIDFFRGDLLENLPRKKWRNLVFVANLPYISPNEKLPRELDFEPRRALFGGENGVEIYEKFFRQIARDFSDFAGIFCEFAPRQKKFFAKFVRDIFPDRRAEFFCDLTGGTRGVGIF